MNEKCILVAEDDEPIRAGLVDLLRAHGYEPLAAKDGEEALELLLRHEVDLALLDVNMPRINGFKLLKIMSKECPEVPSIILTAHGEEKERVKGLESGADDYVVKPFSPAELLARIAAVLRRSVGRATRVSRGEVAFPGGVLDTEKRCTVLNNTQTYQLREKEYELFYYLLTHPGRVIPQEELLLRVWGSNSRAGETRTVAVTLARLKEKIGPEAAQNIENLRGRGYKWNA